MKLALAIAFACAACGGASGGTDGGGDLPDSGPGAGDAGPLCGNGTVDPDEWCDGNTIACAELGASFSGGTATCRDTCQAWDPSPCTLANAGMFEAVKPAERDPHWAEARCNDGTPFSFVVRMGAASTVWIVYLEGGVFCDDYSMPCAGRDPYLTSTLPFADRSLGAIPFTGLVSDDTTMNPNFAGANQVVAHYCSSDFWAGATTALRPSTGDPAGWYFSGHANVDALIDILVRNYGIDDRQPGLRVLFAGGSAGAFGAHFNVSRVADTLPMTWEGNRLKLLVDAGWMTDWDDPAHRIGAATTSDRDVWTRARAFWAATYDPTCEEMAGDPTDCFFGPGWYPHVSGLLPTLIQQSSVDSSFMGIHEIMPGTTGGMAWRAEVEASLGTVERLFSGAQSYHVLGLDDAGLGLGPPGSTFRAVVGRFWNGGQPERVTF